MTYQYGFEHHGFNNLRNRSFWRVLHDPALWKLLGPFVEKHGLVLWSTLFYAWETNTCRGAMSSANNFGFEHGIYVDNRAKTEQELVLRKWEVLHDVVGWVTHEETQVFWSRVTGEDIFGYEYKASKERSQKESRVTLFLAWRFFFSVSKKQRCLGSVASGHLYNVGVVRDLCLGLYWSEVTFHWCFFFLVSERVQSGGK